MRCGGSILHAYLYSRLVIEYSNLRWSIGRNIDEVIETGELVVLDRLAMASSISTDVLQEVGF